MDKMNIQTINKILLPFVILLSVLSCKDNKSEAKNEQSRNSMAKRQISENPYEGLRNQAVTVTYEQLGLKLENDDDIYGLVMDWNMGDVIVTVVAFRTGDASVYLSSGQSFIGGHAHDSVVQAAQRFIAKGSLFLNKAKQAVSTAPPDKGKTGFYILTKSRKYYIEDQSEKIENNQSALTDLFAAANDVITEYRLITDKK
jgi:hypothetical protein